MRLSLDQLKLQRNIINLFYKLPNMISFKWYTQSACASNWYLQPISNRTGDVTIDEKRHLTQHKINDRQWNLVT